MHKLNQSTRCAASRSKSELVSQHTRRQSRSNPIIYNKFFGNATKDWCDRDWPVVRQWFWSRVFWYWVTIAVRHCFGTIPVWNDKLNRYALTSAILYEHFWKNQFGILSEPGEVRLTLLSNPSIRKGSVGNKSVCISFLWSKIVLRSCVWCFSTSELS